MRIDDVTVGPVGTRCYILSQEDRKDCLLIDPGDEPERIRKAVGGKRIAGILLTHGHFDHIGAVGALMEADTRLAIHALDAPMLRDPALNAGLGLLGREIVAPDPTDLLKEGDEWSIAGLRFRVYHTPGHTPGSCCYLFGEDWFTGDTMFDHGWGRTDLPGGNERQMMSSLRRLIPLTREKKIYAGHFA